MEKIDCKGLYIYKDKKFVPYELTNSIANKMIRPTTIPQSLNDLKIEQALAREALRLSFIQHKEFAVSLKGIQQERTISDTFDQKISGETIVDMKNLCWTVVAPTHKAVGVLRQYLEVLVGMYLKFSGGETGTNYCRKMKWDIYCVKWKILWMEIFKI